MADLESAATRDRIRRILVSEWFPENEQKALYTALGLSDSKLRQMEWAEAVAEEDVSVGRDANFRVRVVTSYRFTCALTGYGLYTNKGYAIVEAAHIHAFAKSKNNSPSNGLALTRDAHWMFDQGLWTISDNNRITVADEIFTEWGREVNWLKSRHEQPATFHANAELRPCEKYLCWHRKNVFNK